MSPLLDSVDRQILACLHRDARISNRRIAGALGISEGTVRSRIGRMQARGQVRFTATVDAGVLFDPISGLIGVNVSGGAVARVSRALAALPEVNFVARMLGRFDIFCTFLLREQAELADLLQTTIPSIPGVRNTEFIPVIEVFKYDRRWSVLNLAADQAG